MSDILYILGNGSKHDNMEIRLSLRTVEKYAKNLDRVFVVGVLPNWMTNVTHIPCGDNFHKEQNHVRKVMKAIENGISENFLLMNDDFFMMKKFDVENYPYFVRGELEYEKNPSRYQQMLNKTVLYLREHGIQNPLGFHVHCPIIYNSENFKSLNDFFWRHRFDSVGYSPRVIYGNMFVKETIQAEDCKMIDGLWKENTPQGCISTKADCKDILEKLEKMFPKKSKYEKD